jgi:hypothetical protein
MFPRPLDHNEGVGRKIVRRVLALGILTALAAVVLAADSGDTIPADGGAIQGKYDNVEIPFVGSLTNLLRP